MLLTTAATAVLRTVSRVRAGAHFPLTFDGLAQFTLACRTRVRTWTVKTFVKNVRPLQLVPLSPCTASATSALATAPPLASAPADCKGFNTLCRVQVDVCLDLSTVCCAMYTLDRQQTWTLTCDQLQMLHSYPT